MLHEDYLPFHKFKGHMIILDGWDEDMSFDGILIKQDRCRLQCGGISDQKRA